MYCSHPTQKHLLTSTHVISCEYLIIVVKHSPRLCLNLSSLAFLQKLLSPRNISFLVWHQMGLKWSISHYLGKSQIRHGTLKDITNNSSESYCFIEYAPVSVSKNPISVCHSWYKGVQLSFRIGLFINL